MWVHQQPHNIGILLCPMFCYKRGGLWLLEHQCYKLLVNKSINLDIPWALMYQSKCDERERRPLFYNGKFMLAHHTKPQDTLWRTSRLFSNGRTPRTNMAPAAHMYTHAQTQTRRHTHIHTYANTWRHAHIECTCTHMQAHVHMHTHTLTHRLTD